MIQQTDLPNRPAWERWRKARLQGETHFDIRLPENFPCTVAWMWTNEVLHFSYVYPALAGGPIKFGGNANDQDVTTVAQWLFDSGYECKIWRDGFRVEQTLPSDICC